MNAGSSLEREYAAPPAVVWHAWTSADGIGAWWGPRGFEVKVDAIDLRPGGELRTTMTARGEDQRRFVEAAGLPVSTTTRLRYVEVEPERRLGWVHLVEFVPGVAPYEAHGSLELTPTPRGTHARLQLGPMHDAEWTQRAAMGWTEELGKLEAHLRRVLPREGGCTCGAIRYRLRTGPFWVNCCHCTWCQRETGSAFAINAMIEADRVELLSGAPEVVDTPSASGRGQRIHRCPSCRVALWSNYAGAGTTVHFVRVGTLDDARALPPDIHIFTTTKQPWVLLPPDVPAVPEYFVAREYWPPDTRARRRALTATP
jgi:uncharacterized protein YndB with AHSA1/START domain